MLERNANYWWLNTGLLLSMYNELKLQFLNWQIKSCSQIKILNIRRTLTNANLKNAAQLCPIIVFLKAFDLQIKFSDKQV